MALFKPFRGTRASLDLIEKHDGYAYFCTDDGSFHIDYVDDNGNLQRKQISEDFIKQYVNEKTGELDIPTKTSELTNDSGFLTNYTETDPTVPDWAKQPNKPIYTASEVGAADAEHNHDDAYDTKGSAEGALTSANEYTNTTMEEFTLNMSDVLTQFMAMLYGEENWEKLQEGEILSVPDLAAPVVADAVTNHDNDGSAHSDIRELIEGLTTRLNALANSDDTTLDQLSEIVAYIKSNKSLIDNITTSKVNVSDIVDNLTSSATNKPLSAAQGAVLKALIDAIKVPTKLSELSGDTTHRTVTDTEKSAWNAKSNFSGAYADLTGKPTIPTVPTKVSAFDNDKGYITGYTETDPTVPSHVKSITSADISKWNNKSDFSGNYNDLTNKPTIPTVPTNISAFTNDSMYISNEDIVDNLETITSTKPLSAGQGAMLSLNLDALRQEMYDFLDDAVYTHNIIDHLGSSNKELPLSANQGRVLKEMIDDITVPTKTSQLTNDSGFLTQHQDISGKADKSQGIFYIQGDSNSTTDTTNKVATWIGSHDEITEYFNGLTILYKVVTAGSTTTTLNINGLGAVTVVRNATTGISTACPVDGILLLTYTVDSNGTAYWKTADYDANTKNTAGTSNKTGTKLYLVGGGSQSSSGVTTYTNSNIYIDTSNVLNSGKGFKGALVGNADTATKATQDANGNVITSTYETKADAAAMYEQLSAEIDNEKGNIVQQIIAELQGLPVFGVVDENNNITVTSELSDGTYTLKYENADGTTTDIGTIIVSAGSGSGSEPTPTYVNLIPTAKTPTDHSTIFNNGLGYMDGKYASSASPYYGDDSATFVTGAIESEKDSVFYIKGVTITPSASHHRLSVLGINGNCNAAKPFSQMTDYATLETLGTQYYKLTMNVDYINANFANFKYIMISAEGSGANCIISKTPIE